jgi:transcription initiation factor TFIIH subunit 4
MIVMTPEFYEGFRECLRHFAICPWQVVSLNGIAEKESPESLERYSYEVWDKVLHFLVGSDSVEAPPDDLVNRLLDTNLMQPDPEDPRPPNEAALVITEKGYDFMLQDQYKQVWLFVEDFLERIGKAADTSIMTDCLLLLVCLSLARVGEAYSLKSVRNKTMRQCLKGLFSSIGLVKIQEIPVKAGENIKSFAVFYPTRVATQLIGSTSADKANMTPASALWSLSSQALESALLHPQPNDSAHLAIIVQSTFQVCAYTTSELHLRMLSLFCDVPSIRRLPNVIFLRITRDSVKGAFNLGIQARQILRFLEKNAHPRLRNRNKNAPAGQGMSPIPSNVEDQIWLWDRERSRVAMTEVYQQNCKSDAAFNHILQKTKEIGAHVWSDHRKRVIYVDYAQAKSVRDLANKYNGNPYP